MEREGKLASRCRRVRFSHHQRGLALQVAALGVARAAWAVDARAKVSALCYC